MTSGSIKAAALTDLGRKRKNNEDSILSLPQYGVFCVADGMGGGREGQVASKAITDALQQCVVEDAVAWDSRDLKTRAQRIRAGAIQVNTWIQKRAKDREFDQMGSTLVAAVFDPKAPTQGIVIHAGDSRLYRYRDRFLEQLTKDHTFVAEMGVRSDKDLPAEFRGVVTKAIGLHSDVELDETPFDIRPQDVFILCSDGLTRMLADKLLIKKLRQKENEGPESLARMLVDEANKAGGEDNISVVVVCPDFGLSATFTPLAPPLSQPSEQADGPPTAQTATRDPSARSPSVVPLALPVSKPSAPPEEFPEKDTVEGVTPETGDRNDKGQRGEVRPYVSPAMAVSAKGGTVSSFPWKAAVGSLAVIVIGVSLVWFITVRKERHAAIAGGPVTGVVSPGPVTNPPAVAPPTITATSLIVTSYTVAVVAPASTTITSVPAQVVTVPATGLLHEVAETVSTAQVGRLATAALAAVTTTAPPQLPVATVVSSVVAVVVTTPPPAPTTNVEVATVTPEPVHVPSPTSTPPLATQAVLTVKIGDSSDVESSFDGARRMFGERRDSALRTGRWGALRKEFRPWMNKLEPLEPDVARRACIMAWLAVWDAAARSNGLETVEARSGTMQMVAKLVDARLPVWTVSGASEDEKADAFCRSLNESQTILLKGIAAFASREGNAVTDLGDFTKRIPALCDLVDDPIATATGPKICSALTDVTVRASELRVWAAERLTAALPIKPEDYPRKEIMTVVSGGAAWAQLHVLIQNLDSPLAVKSGRADQKVIERWDRIDSLRRDIVLDRERDEGKDLRAWRQRADAVRVGTLLAEAEQLTQAKGNGSSISSPR